MTTPPSVPVSPEPTPATPASRGWEAVIDLPDDGPVAHAAALVGRVLSTVIGDAEGMRGDVVVRERDTEQEVLRIDAGADEETVALLELVRSDLDELDPAAFREKWTAAAEESHES